MHAGGLSLSVPVQVITHLAYSLNSEKRPVVPPLMSLTASRYAHRMRVMVENY